ncbi:MAG: hypothetical protein ACHQCE_13540 [Streptosporangiales bacterium]
MSTPEPMRPEQMRTAVARYVEEIHRAYVAQALTFPAAVRGREELVDEMAGAAAAGLLRAHAMLAAALMPRNAALSALAAEARPDPDAVRRELLAAVGGRTQWQPPEEPSPSAQPTRPAPSAQPTRPAP